MPSLIKAQNAPFAVDGDESPLGTQNIHQGRISGSGARANR